MSPFLGEFLGTLILILLGNGVVANVVLQNTKGHGSGWIVIALGWGMAVFIAVWCVAESSGAHINPAVTIGLAAAGKFGWMEVPSYLLAQLLGAMLGALLAYLSYRDHYQVTPDADAKLATFATSPAIANPTRNFLSECIGTFVLVFAVLFAVEPSLLTEHTVDGSTEISEAKIGLGPLGAIPVGLLVLSIGLSLGGTTGYAINPARDLGPRIVHALLPIPDKGNSNWGYAWIPVAGPVAGCLVAAFLFRLIGPG